MKRNNGLEIKGMKMVVHWAKYDRENNRQQNSSKSEKQNVQPKRIWIPSIRDTRSYKQVVETVRVVEVPTDKKLGALEKSLAISRKVLTWRRRKDSLKRKGTAILQ